MNPTVGSLFAGIGGFDLGFERAGFDIAWQVEIDPFCRKVLAKNFPNAERFDDVRTVGAHNLRPVDVICGGFPCQDISHGGKMAGIDGTRSGLWSEYNRILRILRPRYALIENVAALIGLGLERVLCDLAEIGFDAEWQTLSAAAIGAAHWRDRVWILAYPRREGIYERGEYSDAVPEGIVVPGIAGYELPWQQEISFQVLAQSRGVRAGEHPHWKVEPSVARVADGIPERMDRIKGCGNAVVPQIPEMYARAIKELLDARYSSI